MTKQSSKRYLCSLRFPVLGMNRTPTLRHLPPQVKDKMGRSQAKVWYPWIGPSLVGGGRGQVCLLLILFSFKTSLLKPFHTGSSKCKSQNPQVDQLEDILRQACLSMKTGDWSSWARQVSKGPGLSPKQGARCMGEAQHFLVPAGHLAVDHSTPAYVLAESTYWKWVVTLEKLSISFLIKTNF